MGRPWSIELLTHLTSSLDSCPFQSRQQVMVSNMNNTDRNMQILPWIEKSFLNNDSIYIYSFLKYPHPHIRTGHPHYRMEC